MDDVRMDWRTLSGFAWFQGTLAVTPIFLLVLAVLWRSLPDEASRVKRLLASFAAAVGCQFGGQILQQIGYVGAGTYVAGFGILVAGIAVIEAGCVVIFQVLLERFGVSPPRILRDLTIGVAVVVWGFVRLHAAGLDLASIVTTSAVLTAVVGFSLQETLGNILGGLALQIDRSIKRGDWIEIDGVGGRVIDVGWRKTWIDRTTGEVVVIPNSVLVKNRFSLLCKQPDRPGVILRQLPFLIDADTPPQRVIDAVEKAINSATIPLVSRTYGARCIITDLGQTPIRYTVSYWLENPAEGRLTDAAVRLHAFYALQRVGISLAYPTQNVHIARSTQKPESLWYSDRRARKTALSGIDLFAGLSDDELDRVADHLTVVTYADGDVLVRQGDIATNLFLVVDGKADVTVEKNGRTAKISEVARGTFFGEYGLMTGEPRKATVTANGIVTCYSLEKADFCQILRQRPEIADYISRVLASRTSALEETTHRLDREAEADHAPSHADLSHRIREFFGLQTAPLSHG